VLGGFGARKILQRARSRRGRTAAFAATVLLVMIDLRPALDLTPVWATPPSVYATLAGRTDVVLAEFPFDVSGLGTTRELPFMYFSVWHGLPMVDGYSGFVPEDHERLVEAVREFPDARALEALRARGVTHVTANCALMPDGCAAFLARAGSSPALALVASDMWQGQPVRLYELRR